MKPASKDPNLTLKVPQQTALVPVFNALAIQKEIAITIEPILRQHAMLQQFFQQNHSLIQNMVRDVNRAVESYRQVFRVMDDVRDQILQVQKERENILSSVREAMSAWHHFAHNWSSLEVVERIQKDTREAEIESSVEVQEQEELSEVITEKILSLVKEEALRSSNLLATPAIISLPSGTRWESLTLTFLNELEIEVRLGRKLIGRYDHQKLGFANLKTKDKRANKAWVLLRLLSVLGSQKATVEMVSTSGHFSKTSKNNIHATMVILSKQLREAFGLWEDDPFYNYWEYRYYKPRFTLKPLPLLRGDGEVFISEKRRGFSEDPQLEDDLY